MKAMTVSAKPETVQQDWYLIDASGKVGGFDVEIRVLSLQELRQLGDARPLDRFAGN